MADNSTAPQVESSQPSAKPSAPAAPAPQPPAEPASHGEPLPIWFFVGLILLVYGLIVVGSGLFSAPRPTVLAETRPALWWGAILSVAGAIFLVGGLKVHRSGK
jgi:hypothetical protein